MPNPLKLISKPEYVLRPSQVLKRLARIGKPVPPSATVRLPWGAMVTVHTQENVGSEIYHYGIFDKIVPEALWRLLDPGDTALEIGANIGQNSLLMAARAGRGGRVLAFEPHPEIFAELKANHEQSHGPQVAAVQLENVALGESTGEAVLVESDEFSHNRGSAALQKEAQGGHGRKVQVRRLDEFLETLNQVGVCKIDVEGYELGVLRGAQQALGRRVIRDIVFEDFGPKPSPVTELLRQHGFMLFELHETWLKPRLVPLDPTAPSKSGFSFNYLATLDAPRAVARFRAPGWHCLLSL